MTAPISLLVAFVGLFVSARIQIRGVLFGQPVSVPLLGLVGAVLVLAIIAVILWLLRSIVREGLRLKPRAATI
jgi:hypothetical protein